MKEVLTSFTLVRVASKSPAAEWPLSVLHYHILNIFKNIADEHEHVSRILLLHLVNN